MPRPLVIYIGDRKTAELAAPLEWLDERASVVSAENAQRACDLIQSSPAPLAIFVGQSRAGEHPNAAFERLREMAPLATIVSLLGSWCEGQARTGKPWPGAIRLYAHQFVPRVGSQLAELGKSGTMSWSPPFTATDEDRLLAASPWPRAGTRKHIAVVSKQRESAAALCDALATAGYDAQCIPLPARSLGTRRGEERAGRGSGSSVLAQPLDLAIWDCPAGFAESRNDFVELTRRSPGVPWITLVSFPRCGDRAELAALGAAAVISKPFLVDDLLGEVRACLPI
jgi:hypothetical protein